jgi:hypothetical protein
MIQVELKELSINVGLDVYEMLREIGPGENGFVNEANGCQLFEIKEGRRYWKIAPNR